MENKYPKLYKCSKDSFYEYILKEELRKTQGNIFHSNNYLNKDNVRLAYVETSSWGAGEIYMIAIDTSNLETLETVNKMIDGK